MKKTKLFKGLTATFGSTFIILGFMSSLAFKREADINTFFQIKHNDVTSGSKFANVDELKAAEENHFVNVVEEGSVLLKNDDKALPLKSEKKITLFGNASYRSVYHGASGGPSNSGYTLHDALVDEGFEINETIYQKTKDNSKMQKNSDIGEVNADIYSESDFSGYTDAAIVVFARYGGEQNDLDVKDSYGVPELSLHESEKAILTKVKNGGFKKIIVLLNTGYAMDLGWLDEYSVDACMWIGFPGQSGMKAVGRMIRGEISPSGSLVDTYATDSLSAPAMQNFGDFKFSDLENNMYHCEYLIYQEGIYVGYKYYETRYHDQVLNINNAKSSKGAFVDTTSWDYAKEIVYPFGYGLSYSSFEQKMTDFDWDRESHTVKATVEVKNIGDFTTKDAVQLYISLPYENGQAEKSAIQLASFAKTKDIKPGESETVKLEFTDYIFATYDENATNGKDTNKKGCYTFDKGDYLFALGDDCHDALNNVLSFNGQTTLFDQDGKSVTGDTSKVKKVTLSELDNTTYATSPHTGEVVSNQFDQVNLNYYEENKITYLTRSDWNTFPTSQTEINASDDKSGTIKKYMTATSSLYVKPENSKDVSEFKHSQEKTIDFIDLKDLNYDDPKWETFIDQLTPTELSSIFGDSHGHEAIENVNFPAYTQGDGPDGMMSGGTLHPSQNLAASTLNVSLLKERGELLAEQAIYYTSFSGLFGPGCNMHRTQYCGRNFEYFSEDSSVAYYLGMAIANGLSEGKLISMFKHFCGNDQETNRHGVATFMTEQALRQNETRSFEGALSNKGGSLGNMSSYNRLGVISTACYKPLMTQLLRNEWGFKGISITDSSKDATSYLFTADALDAGTTVFDNDKDRSSEVKNLLIKNRDGYIWEKARGAAKNYFYAMSRSNLIYVSSLTGGDGVKKSMPWWKTSIIVLDSVIGVLTLASLGLYIFFFIKKKGA